MSLQPHTSVFDPAGERHYSHQLVVQNEPAGMHFARSAWQPHPNPAFGFILAASFGICVWTIVWMLVG